MVFGVSLHFLLQPIALICHHLHLCHENFAPDPGNRGRIHVSVWLDSHAPSPTSPRVPATQTEARREVRSARSLGPAEPVEGVPHNSPPSREKKTLPERTFMLAAKQAGPISVASGRGSQLGSGVLPRPRLALLEAQAFKIQSACFTLTARSLRTDRSLLFKIR